MRIIKLGLISIAILIVIIVGISFLFPSHVRLSKAINLPNQRDSIFALLKQESRWHPMYADSSFTSKAIQVKPIAQTDSTYITQVQQGSRKPVISGWQLYGATASDSLTLQWYMDFDLGWYPWQKFSSLLYEQTYGRMMQTGLTNFRKQLMKE